MTLRFKTIASLVLGLLAFPGGAAAAEAGTPRTEILLAPAERELILAEMRQFLAGVQGITEGLSRDDLTAVAGAARALGMRAAQGMPEGVGAKLPPGFRQLGRSVHQEFDQIALDAETLGDADHTLAQLSQVLGQCVACHSAYALTSAPPGPPR